jgi:DNA topoisomerase-2
MQLTCAQLTHLEHIMKRPDTYIGSVERQTDKMWVYNSANECMEFRDVSYVPGLYKIFDEILVNAADNKQNDKNMSEIRVTVDRETGEVSVKNDGKGIPIEIHQVRRKLNLAQTRAYAPRNMEFTCQR